jgi:transposase
MRTITLNGKQQRKVEILTRLEAGGISVGEAAMLLGISERQVRRQRVRYRERGMASVVHGNGGRTPANRTDEEVLVRIVALAGPAGKYHDLNVSHLQELLVQEEQIVIGRSTLDRLLKQAGVRQKRRPTPVTHRRKRQRRSAEGMLVQIDGSPFAWLEARGPRAVLVGAIDDATGKVLFLQFRPTEDQVGYLLLLRSLAQAYGLPMSIYHDRHTILRSPKQPTLDEQLNRQTPMSQIQRIMAELGIESIPAYSPQAKGRIERLWGTLQARLTKELRLHNIATLEAANAFLPDFIIRYNAHFAREPQDHNSAWVPLPEDLDINYYFAVRETRKVRADHCISFGRQLLQLLPGKRDPSLTNQTVTVHVVPEGDIYLYQGKRRIDHRQLPPEPSAQRCAMTTPDDQQEGKAQPARQAPKRKVVTLTSPPAAQTPVRTATLTARQRAWLFGQRWSD